MNFRIGSLFVWLENWELCVLTRRGAFGCVIGPRTLSLSAGRRGFLLHPGQSQWL
jgi:hypothetical protein